MNSSSSITRLIYEVFKEVIVGQGIFAYHAEYSHKCSLKERELTFNQRNPLYLKLQPSCGLQTLSSLKVPESSWNTLSWDLASHCSSGPWTSPCHVEPGPQETSTPLPPSSQAINTSANTIMLCSKSAIKSEWDCPSLLEMSSAC